MKVQLIVVRGKPEGKVIPLVGPKFKIGRGETCHLRPNSEQVSREHAEFTISGEVVSVSDLGSRNGTLVNGKALTEACQLKDRDLVQVGPLTFAVSIQKGAPTAAAAAPAKPAAPAAAPPPKPKPATPPPAPQAKASPEDVSNDEIDAWLFGDSAGATADHPTGVYGGDTITIAAFKDASQTPAAPSGSPSKPPSVVSDDEYERQSEEDEVQFDDMDDEQEDEEEDEAEEEAASLEDEFIDESNPFYAAKKAQKEQEKSGGKSTGGANQQFKDTTDAASEILKKLMEKRRASK